MTRKALLIGATGLAGKQCLYQLFENENYAEVHCLVRRRLHYKNPKLHQHLVDFNAPDRAFFPEVQDVFCMIGTTIRKAGSKDVFRKVDYEYPLKFAEMSLSKGAEQFLLVSSMGADPGSPVFYTRTKGELEEALKKLPFKALHIFRPFFLDGDRAEFRPAERFVLLIFRTIRFLLEGPLKKYQPVKVATLARAMIRAATEKSAGIHVYESDEILRTGRKS